MAARSGAAAVMAAAGSLRALAVVLAVVRVPAFALVAVLSVPAIDIDTAFGADTRAVVEVVAADVPVAAIELGAPLGGLDAANGALWPATFVTFDALAIAALFALAALPIADTLGAVGAGTAVVVATAFGAGRARFGFAAEQVAAANDGIFARIGFAKGAESANLSLAAVADGDAFVFAAFFAFFAMFRADAADAETAGAIAVTATLIALAAFTGSAAEVVLAAGSLGVRAVDDLARVSTVPAALALGDAFITAAFFASVAIIETDAAVAASAGALVIGAALAWPGLANAEDADFAGGAILVAATLGASGFVRRIAAQQAIGARGLGITGAVAAVATAGTVVIGAAFTLHPAIVREGAAVFARRAPGNARSPVAGTANGRAIGISATLGFLTDTLVVADLAAGASIVVAALRAIGARRVVAAAALAGSAVGAITAFAVNAGGGFARIDRG